MTFRTDEVHFAVIPPFFPLRYNLDLLSHALHATAVRHNSRVRSSCLAYLSSLPSYSLALQGLEKRVQDLVNGYRELNDLAEQAPLYVTNAATDYARKLGGQPQHTPSNVGDQETGQGQIRVCRTTQY